MHCVVVATVLLFIAGHPAVFADPGFGQWVEEVVAMPAEKQVEAVVDKLKKVNPGLQLRVEPRIEAGMVTQLVLYPDEGPKELDVSPLRALKHLRHFKCSGRVTNLSLLQRMAAEEVEAVVEKLKKLNPGVQFGFQRKIEGAIVTELSLSAVGGPKRLDLSPLRELKGLRRFSGGSADLSPLQGMALEHLGCSYTLVTDLSPLKGMPLATLECSHTPLADLSPLKGMRLTRLNIAGTQVTDLSPLEGMKLERLHCSNTPVADLSPLKGMPLEHFDFVGTKVTDLSPLQGLKFTELNCSHTPVADLSPLKGMPLTKLDCAHSPVADLSPLKGMPLAKLDCTQTPVADLSPHKGMPLTTLDCAGTKVADLSPLEGIRLTTLHCQETQVTDLTPLKKMSQAGLFWLCITPKDIVSGMEAIRQMPLRAEIGDNPRRMQETPQFWEKYAAGGFNN
jgi:hypothetical protein